MFEGRPSTFGWWLLEVPQTNPRFSQWWFWANYYIFFKKTCTKAILGKIPVTITTIFWVFLIGGWTGRYNLPRWSCCTFRSKILDPFLLKHRSTIRGGLKTSGNLILTYDIWRIFLGLENNNKQLLHEKGGHGLLKRRCYDTIFIREIRQKWPCTCIKFHHNKRGVIQWSLSNSLKLMMK